jgi:DNA repair protein RecO (recombination protein O)
MSPSRATAVRGATPAAAREAGRTALRTVARAAPLAAYVLQRWDWSETSLVVELFTRQAGRIVVVAKGAKRPTSQLRPVLLPFQPLWAQLGKMPADDGGEMRLLRNAEWAGGAPLLPPAALLSGYYLNELLMKLLARQDPHPALYDAYAATLAALAAAHAPAPDLPSLASATARQPPATPGAAAAAAPRFPLAGNAAGAAHAPCAPRGSEAEGGALRAFELSLLREIGLLPDLGCVTLDGAPLQPQRGYGLLPEAGLAPQADGVPGRAWLALRSVLQPAAGAAVDAGAAVAALQALCMPLSSTLRGPLRQVLHYHLGHTLHTRQIRLELQRLAGPGARAG